MKPYKILNKLQRALTAEEEAILDEMHELAKKLNPPGVYQFFINPDNRDGNRIHGISFSLKWERDQDWKEEGFKG